MRTRYDALDRQWEYSFMTRPLPHISSDVAGADLVEMTVRPAHRRLDREVQTVEPDVERHLDTAEDRGFYIIERDLEVGDGVGTHAARLRRSLSSAQCHGNSAPRSVVPVLA